MRVVRFFTFVRTFEREDDDDDDDDDDEEEEEDDIEGEGKPLCFLVLVSPPFIVPFFFTFSSSSSSLSSPLMAP